MRFPWSRPEEALRVRSRMAGKQEEFWTCQLEFARGMSKRPGNRKDSGPVSWNRVRKSPKTRETVSYLDIYTQILRENVRKNRNSEVFWTYLLEKRVKRSRQPRGRKDSGPFLPEFA